MDERYLIRVEGKVEQDGEVDSINLLTRGSFEHKGGSYHISYHESDATGYEGNVTTVSIDGVRRVQMERRGTMPSQLIIEPGRRHVCHYDSAYGVLSLGVAADEVLNALTDAGGEVTFSYTLDSGESHISRNTVKITVQEAN